MRRVRRLCLALMGALLLLPAAPGSSASASSVTVTDTVDAAWGKADIRIVRSAWTVHISGTVTDERADGDCVYVEAVLAVDDWADPDGRIPNHCGGKGTSAPISISLTPGKGSKLVSVRYRVCAADAFADSCLEHSRTVPSERPLRPEYRDEIDAYQSMSMASFKAALAAKPGPYDWSNDGCSSSPDSPGGFPFKDACNRHDFGYRNYGKGTLRAAPYDSVRASVDARFRSDMLNVCNRYSGDAKVDCQGWAQTYYLAVRTQGGRAFYRNG